MLRDDGITVVSDGSYLFSMDEERVSFAIFAGHSASSIGELIFTAPSSVVRHAVCGQFIKERSSVHAELTAVYVACVEMRSMGLLAVRSRIVWFTDSKSVIDMLHRRVQVRNFSIRRMLNTLLRLSAAVAEETGTPLLQMISWKFIPGDEMKQSVLRQ